jgi:hypothetical protein
MVTEDSATPRKLSSVEGIKIRSNYLKDPLAEVETQS